MPTTFTPEDTILLGYAKASSNRFSGYDVIDASSTVGIADVTTRFIYLKSRCTIEAAKEAASNYSNKHSVYVVKSPSLSIQDARLRKIFGVTTELFAQEELVWKVLKKSFSDYFQHLLDHIPQEQHFISPRLASPKTNDDLVSNLVDYLSGRSTSTDNGTLRVLSANAGVGKTTLSRHLVHELVSKIGTTKTIPIYVEAQHWKKLNLSSLEALWDVIDNSLQFFSAPRQQMTESLFRHALRQGYFSFIFDGFDELCGHEIGQFDPAMVLDQLNEIVAESEARVLLTTRTLFWNAKINQVPEYVDVKFLDAFNTQQARGYFKKVFGQGTQKHNHANQLYSTLVKQARPKERTGSVTDQFVNLPLCVRLVADYIRRGGISVTAIAEEPILKSFLLAICEREINRQGLATPARSQMNSFRDMALSYEGVNPNFGVDDLGATPEGFSNDDLEKVIDHALLNGPVDTDAEKFVFRYDFVASFLRAETVSDWIRGASEEIGDLPSSIVGTLTEEADGKGQILEQLLNFLDEGDLSNVLKKGRISVVSSRESYIGSFFFHVGQALLGAVPGTTSSERAKILFRGLAGAGSSEGTRVIGEWAFRGPIERLDLREVSFEKCKFRDVSFRRCVVDSSTVFKDCVFEGNQLVEGSKSGWRLVKFYDCEFKFPADVIMEQLVREKLSDDRTTVLHMLSVGLKKFWYHGKVKSSLRTVHWRRGPLAQTGQTGAVLDAMLKENLVSRIKISGVSEGGLAFDTESIGDLQNFMDNNQLSGKIEAVYRRLLTTWS